MGKSNIQEASFIKYSASLIMMAFMLSDCFSQSDIQRLDEIFRNSYESYLISKGDNRPDFDRRKDNIDRFLVSLSYNIPPELFMKKAGWTKEMYESKVKLLTSKGWLKTEGNKLVPTVFIVTGDRGSMLYRYAKPVSDAIAGSIEKELPGIKDRFIKAGFEVNNSFEDLSLLILSDVLLDNWQLMKMESAFLKQENRPLRHGKYYYAEIIENPGNGYEPFKIYGNQSGKVNDTTWLNIYGNNRFVANSRLRNRTFSDSVMAHCLNITPEMSRFFEETAEGYKPVLLKILEENRDYSISVFRKTGYADQIRFEEFFIWWYHFIYTEATNILAGKNLIRIPDGGNFYYR